MSILCLQVLGYSWVLRDTLLCELNIAGHAALLLFHIFCLHITVVWEREILQGLLSGGAFGLHGALLA